MFLGESYYKSNCDSSMYFLLIVSTLENALQGKRMCSFSVAAAFLRPFDEE